MRTIPVDLILHSLADLLAELPAESATSTYADPLARCIRHDLLAEQWTSGAGVMQHADWLARRLDPEQRDFIGKHHISGETRALEVATARRLADTAFAMLVEQDAEATSRATTLLRAAQAIVGLAVEQPAKGFALPTYESWRSGVAAEVMAKRDAALSVHAARWTAIQERDLAAAGRDVKALKGELGAIRTALDLRPQADIVVGARSVAELAASAREVGEYFATYKGPCAPPAGVRIADAVKTTIEALAARDALAEEASRINVFLAVYSGPHKPTPGVKLSEAVAQTVRNLRTNLESITRERDALQPKPHAEFKVGDRVTFTFRGCSKVGKILRVDTDDDETMCKVKSDDGRITWVSLKFLTIA